MIIFIVFSVVILIFFYKNKHDNVIQVLFFYYLAIFIFTLKLFEYVFGQIDFFISDEIYYFEEATYNFFEVNDKERYLWLLLNYIFKNFDFFGEFGIKLINIPIGLFALVALNRAYGINISPVSYVLFLPYLLVTFTFNLRDNLILLFSILLFISLDKVSIKNIWAVLLLSIGLAFTRPLFILLILSIFLFVKVMFSENNSSGKRSKGKLILLSAIFIGIGFFLIGQFLQEIVVKYYINLELMVNNNFENKTDEIGYQLSGNIFKDLANSLFRFILAPLPHSLFKRLFEEITIWGITDEIVRIIHQSIYFFLLFYLIYNLKSFIVILKRMDHKRLMVTLFLLSQALIYSIYQLGGTHQRTKIPFQLAIFILCYLINNYKKELKNGKTKNSNSL